MLGEGKGRWNPDTPSLRLFQLSLSEEVGGGRQKEEEGKPSIEWSKTERTHFTFIVDSFPLPRGPSLLQEGTPFPSLQGPLGPFPSPQGFK